MNPIKERFVIHWRAVEEQVQKNRLVDAFAHVFVSNFLYISINLTIPQLLAANIFMFRFLMNKTGESLKTHDIRVQSRVMSTQHKHMSDVASHGTVASGTIVSVIASSHLQPKEAVARDQIVFNFVGYISILLIGFVL